MDPGFDEFQNRDERPGIFVGHGLRKYKTCAAKVDCRLDSNLRLANKYKTLLGIIRINYKLVMN